MTWFILRTQSQREEAVRDRLAGWGFDPYLPMRRVELRRGPSRARVDAIRPLFPGYLLLPLDPELGWFSRVLDAPGAIGFLHDEQGRPAPATESDLTAIRAIESRLEADAKVREASRNRPDFRVGDEVIVDGEDNLWKNYIGCVERVGKGGQISVVLMTPSGLWRVATHWTRLRKTEADCESGCDRSSKTEDPASPKLAQSHT
jgi:transcription antitermination factor NusG